MPDLTTPSPLYAPISYAGQTYFTSQYFHREYLTNSQRAGKYQRHGHFLRLLRSIEAYQLYLAKDDIIELPWSRIKTEANHNRVYFQPLFEAAGYRPLTLLNATAQVAMSHHLDDALSQQVSVAANTLVARQPHNLPTTPLQALLAQNQVIAQALEHIVQLEQRQEEQEQRLTAIEARRPPEGKMDVIGWLRRYSKPHLPAQVLSHLKYLCRQREDPEPWRPEHFDFAIPYYTEETIAAAYMDATRQLSFIHDPGVMYERRPRRKG